VAVSDQIKQAIQAQPDLTLKELQKQLKTSLSVHSLSRALRALQLTFKKKS
jgi:transposase